MLVMWIMMSDLISIQQTYQHKLKSECWQKLIWFQFLKSLWSWWSEKNKTCDLDSAKIGQSKFKFILMMVIGEPEGWVINDENAKVHEGSGPNPSGSLVY